jgi:hypothetical protein
MTTLFNIRLNRNNYSVFVVNNNQNKNKFFDEIKSLKGDLKRNIKLINRFKRYKQLYRFYNSSGFKYKIF